MIQIAVQLGILLGTTIYQRYRSDRDQKKALAEQNKRLPGVDQFQFPIVSESDPVPVLFGTHWLRSPNVLWYGFMRQRQNQGDPEAGVARYDGVVLLSYCMGPIDSIQRITSGGSLIDDTEHDLTGGPVRFALNRYDIWGEPQRGGQGGLNGYWTLMPGLPDQPIANLFTQTLTDSSGTPRPEFRDENGDPIMPAFRGLFTVLLGDYLPPGVTPQITAIVDRDGRLSVLPWDSIDRFYFGSNPTLQPIEMLAQRLLSRGYGASQWYPATVAINITEMNPAHIIHELLSDPVYGYGIKSTDLDDELDVGGTFERAANSCAGDTLGLSFVWGQQQSRYETIREVLRHMGAFLVRNPKTGKYELRILRDDYDVATLPVLGPGQIQSVTRYARPDMSVLPTILEAKYIDRETNSERVVKQDDQAGLLTRGEIREEVYYQMAARGDIAARLASNHMIEASAPLAVVELSIPYCEACDFLPGDVFVWQWPDYGIESMVLRVISVTRGMVEDGNVRVRCREDAYAWRDTVYSSPPISTWIDPITPPQNAVAGALELPLGLWLAGARVSMPFARVDDFANETRSVAGVAAIQPTEAHVGYELWTEGLSSLPRLADDQAQWSALVRIDGELRPTSFGIGGVAANKVLSLKNNSTIPIVGQIIAFGIGSGGKQPQEFVYVTAVFEESGVKKITVERALFDTDELYASVTNPVGVTDPVGVIMGYLWDIDEPLQMANRNYSIDIPRPFTGLDNTSNTRVLTTTGRGTLAFADATQRQVVLEGRPNMPIAPYIALISDTGASTLIAWRHRNRLEDRLVFANQSVPAEPGVEYELKIYEVAPVPTLLRTVSGLTGSDNGYAYTYADENADRGGAGPADIMRFEMRAIRDGKDSYFLRSKLYSRV
jgi:hypothetical protein